MEIKESYTLANGWIAILDMNERSYLKVFPIENSLFNKEKTVKIPIEIYNVIKNGDRDIKSLFSKYELHNYIIQWKQPSMTVNVERENKEGTYYGVGYIAKEENAKYYLYYQLSRQGGGTRKIPISKTAYSELRSSNYELSELFRKYDLYQFDNDKYNEECQ